MARRPGTVGSTAQIVVSDQERGMKRIVNVVCVAAAMLCLAGPVSATPVTFQGGVFDVTVSDLGSDVYRFVYTADFTGWDDTSVDDYITAIDFGLTGWHDVDSVTLVNDTAPGDWVVVQGSGNANNCNENLNQFKICAQEDSLLLSASTEDNQIYTWTIDVAYNTIGTLSALTSDQNPIMAIFYELNCTTDNRTDEVTCRPKQTGNFSLITDYDRTETTTDVVVPEPTMMAMLGAGLLLVARRLRRRSS
jgi:hypothetical protein